MIATNFYLLELNSLENNSSVSETNFDQDLAIGLLIDHESENEINQYNAEQEHEWLKVSFYNFSILSFTQTLK